MKSIPSPGAAEETAPHTTTSNASELPAPRLGRTPAPNGATLRQKRIAHGLAGHLVCKKMDWDRPKLSGVERGYRNVPPEELARLDAVLDELIEIKATL